MSSPNNYVFVLGMHRSGTSALTGLLCAFGANPGNDLLPANDSNPKGFFESQAIVDLNNKILQVAGSSWDDLTPLQVDWFKLPAVQELKSSITAFFSSESLSTEVSVIKDPRLSLTLPLWLEALEDLGITPGVVICSREPGAVAESERLMKGIPIIKSLMMYMNYGLQAEYHSRNLCRIVVRYSDLISDWKTVIKRIDLAFSLGLLHDSDNLQAKGEGFITPELNRSQLGGDEFHSAGTLAEMSNDLYESLEISMMDNVDVLRQRFSAYQNDMQPWVKILKHVQFVEERFPLADLGPRYSSSILKSQMSWADKVNSDFDPDSAVSKKWIYSKERQEIRFNFAGPSVIEKIRLSFVNRPCYVRLHALTLLRNGTHLVKWDSFSELLIGKSKSALDVTENSDTTTIAWLFVDSKGFIDLKLPENKCLALDVGATLLVDFEVADVSAGVRPLFARLGQLKNEIGKLRKQGREKLTLGVNSASVQKLTTDLADLHGLLENALEVRDQRIVAQQQELEKMREELLRAEAQLDLLKDLMIG